MLPLAEFDDPEAMRAFYDELRTTGAQLDRFPGIDVVPLVSLAHETGRSSRARLDLPVDAPFFADHFPRRPVFPDLLIEDDDPCGWGGQGGSGARGFVRRVRRKVRAFTGRALR